MHLLLEYLNFVLMKKLDEKDALYDSVDFGIEFVNTIKHLTQTL